MKESTQRPALALWRMRDVELYTGLSRHTIRRAIEAGDFPPPLQVNKQLHLWRISDVKAWAAGDGTWTQRAAS